MTMSNGFPPAHPDFVPRTLDLQGLLERKSHFLLGPRQTGKSFLIRHTLRGAGVKVYDLLESSTFLALNGEPERIRQELTESDRFVVIDEIQRLPELLNEVHLMIEEMGVSFLLTGSSARKLRRGGVNLLGGRARTIRFHPFSRSELGVRFELNRALQFGLLPSIYFSDDPAADLEAYAGMYLREEIIAEGSARNIPAFSRFLKVAALCSGTIVNFSEVASDAQVPRTTVHEYFELLKDTLVLHEIPAWKESAKRKPIRSSKYYFFDIGVAQSLQGRRIDPGTPEYGAAFEAYILHELKCDSDYRSRLPISHWRTTSGFEVDFILADHTAIEVKAKEHLAPRDLRSLRALMEEKAMERYLCVCREPRPRKVDGIEVLPYELFLDRLNGGDFGG